MSEKGRWVTAREAQEETGCSLNAIYRFAKRKVIKTRQKGRKLEIEISSLVSYLEESKPAHTPAITAAGPPPAPSEEIKPESEANLALPQDKTASFSDAPEDVETAALRSDNEKLQRQIEESGLRAAGLAEANENLTRSNSRLAEELQEIRDKASMLETKNAQLCAELDTTHTTRRNQFDQIGEMQKKLEQTEKTNAGELARLQESLAQKEKEIQRLETERTRTQERCERLETSLVRNKIAWKILFVVSFLTGMLLVIMEYVPMEYFPM